MAATYSGDPSSSDRDLVRFLLGDTTMTEAKLQDGEIDYLITTYVDPYLSAAEGAQVLANTAAHWMSYSADGNSMSLDQLQAKYALMADQLRATYRRLNRAVPWTATANRGEYEAFANDESVVAPLFSVAMHDDNFNDSPYGGGGPEDLRNGLR